MLDRLTGIWFWPFFAVSIGFYILVWRAANRLHLGFAVHSFVGELSARALPMIALLPLAIIASYRRETLGKSIWPVWTFLALWAAAPALMILAYAVIFQLLR